MLTDFLLILLAYWICSFNSALFLCKVFRIPDLRQSGSGNPGMTNMWRNHGPALAIAVLIGDTLKAYIAVGFAKLMGYHPITIEIAAIVAVLGHMYPAQYQFKGGKGVAPACGVLLLLTPLVAIIAILGWWLSTKLFRISSLSALVACLIAPVYSFIAAPEYTILYSLMALVILLKHSENIKRLLTGSEDKVF